MGNNRSLNFVREAISSGRCKGMENDKYEYMSEIDFSAIASKIQFNELVEVSENLWKTKLLFENGGIMEISIKHNPDAKFDYFSTESCYCDGTSLFAINLCERILNNILTGKSCYILKIPREAQEQPYNYDVFFEVGNFVLEEEVAENFLTKEKLWIKSGFIVMLPIKCDFVEK